MTGRRFIWGYVLIGIPAVVATVLSVVGYAKIAPPYERQEKLRITAAYREVAEELQDHPEKGAGVVPPRRGSSRSLKPGRWGFVETGAAAVVWYAEGDRRQAVSVARVEPIPVAFVALSTVTVLLVLLWGFTVAGCWFFRKSAKTRADFVAAAAHDLETPVASLQMVLENRAAGVTTDEEAFAESERLAVRLGRLVDNLRDFIHRGRRGAPVLTDFDVVASLREAYRPFAADYRDLLGDDVPISAAGVPSVRVRADETLTLQILWNLFANDLKYAAPYGTVRVAVTRDASRVRVAFFDAGRGLTPREMKRIFDRYYRARSTMESGKGGFGIGLSSAREFARAMGGDLTVAANAPKGCVFTLELPTGRPAAKIVPIAPKRSMGPLPGFAGNVKMHGDWFADESSEWENA